VEDAHDCDIARFWGLLVVSHRVKSSRKLLAFLVLALLVAGIGFVALSFVQTLSPTTKAIAALPSVDTKDIGRGQAVLVKAESRFGAFVVRDEKNTIHVFRVPISEHGYVQMPDIHWWKPRMECKAFGVHVTAGTPFIGCGDSLPNEYANAYWANAWRWGLDGKTLSGPCDSMEPLSFIQQGSKLRLSGIYGG